MDKMADRFPPATGSADQTVEESVLPHSELPDLAMAAVLAVSAHRLATVVDLRRPTDSVAVATGEDLLLRPTDSAKVAAMSTVPKVRTARVSASPVRTMVTVMCTRKFTSISIESGLNSVK